MSSRHRWLHDGGLVVLICLLAFAIRVYRLDYQSFHYDEYFSLTLARQGLGEILARLTLNEPHPPLYYSLLHLWISAAGDREFAAKFLSLFFGVLVVPVGYRCGREVGGSIAGLGTALLLAVNPFQFYHSQETRMYSTLELLALSSSFFLLRLLRQGSGRLWSGYVVATALAAMAHYEMLLLIAAQVVFVTGRAVLAGPGQLWSRLRHWVAAWGVVGVLYLPWLIAARHIALDYKAGQPLPFVWPNSALRAWQQAQETFVAFNFHLVSVPYGEVQLAAIAALALAATVAALRWPPPRQDRAGIVYLLFSALLPMILALALDLRRPVFAVRYMIFLSPVLAILIALSAIPLARRSRWIAAAPILAVALTYGQATHALLVDPSYARADYRALFRYLGQVARDGDALLLDCGYQDWAATYYLGDRLPTFGFPLAGSERSKQEQQLAELSGNYRRLWLVLGGYTDCDPDGGVERALARVAFKGEERRFSVLRLVSYAGSHAAPSPATSAEQVDFGGQLSLVGWSVGQLPLEPGEIVPVRLEWRGEAKPDRDYAMSVRLLNAADHVVEQRDGMPQDGFRATSSWLAGDTIDDNRGLTLPLGLPPGDYRLELHVYDSADGRPLPAGRTAGTTTSGLLLGSVGVLPAKLFPSLAAVAPLLPLDKRTGPLIAEGYRRQGPSSLRPGDRLRFTVFWRAAAPVAAAPPEFQLSLEQPDGSVAQRRGFRRVESLYPAALWRPGELVRRDYDFALAPTVGGGWYLLRGQQIEPGRQDDLFSEWVLVENGRPLPPAQRSEIPSPSETAFQNGISFLGYKLRGERAAAGDSSRLTLYWSTDRELGRDYTVFVHALDATGRIVAQDDAPPAHGAYPTSLWPEGEVIRDERVLQLPLERLARLAFGLYVPASGERVCIVDVAGRCTGDTIILNGPFS